MDPYAHVPDEMEEMAEKLSRLNSRASSGRSRQVSSLSSSVDDRYERQQNQYLHSHQYHDGAANGTGRRRMVSGGAMTLPLTAAPESAASESPRYLAQDDVFHVPAYDAAAFSRSASKRSSSAAPTLPPSSPRSQQFQFQRKDSYASSERRPSRGSSAGYSLYPAPSKPPPLSKPLPPIPTGPPSSAANRPQTSSRRPSSQPSLDSSDGACGDTSRYSQSSRGSTLERVSSSGSGTPSLPPAAAASSGPFPAILGEYRARPPQLPPPPPMQPQHGPSSVHLVPWKQLTAANEKPLKEPSVYFFDISTTSATLASKHGNNMIRIWSVGSGEVQNSLKISCYTTAQARSREYFVRSHAILSEPSNLLAVAAGFGDTLEIWDWGKKKKLQTIDDANRWAAVRSNVLDAGWCPLVTYNGDADRLDLHAATRHPKKPFKKSRSINLRAANLPVLPKFPELAFSATGPLLVTASGPRPPRPGHPPPERETLLVAWEIDNDDSAAPITTPYKVVAPWHHTELDTALPSGLATYGSVAVSIWIPASYRAVPIPLDRGGTGGFNLAPVTVHDRHVLVWDFAASSTRTFRIPNATSCVSPDCRFVAYCDASGVESGARGCLALLDAMSGRRLWCWPDPEGGVALGEDAVQGVLGDLSKVTEMCFSADGGFLFVGDADGGIVVFEVREGAGGGVEVGLRGR
ncbi:hypothetical protein C8A05DRAFT_47822 [Staphylotrichum tortipilum]|uniref:WD40 repeat-like protein n=1 Tax=Staphylotrichum tortipilum TaxID=2831512 RepID=A0AAN6RPQ7_9PEZI|nr:hypothetical protein C8A05DRAFT_47822 [Staphylotrichum longicolle]